LAYNAADRSGIIKASTLVVTGTEDRVIRPISSEVITSLVPKAKQVRMIGGGHNSSIEMRGECNTEALDFLRS
jgi:pimeloyl-ACP methyl ester carboxylesterase